MKKRFKPDKYYHSIYDINLELLKKEGIKLIACDLDNTLVPHYIRVPDDNVIAWINKTLTMGFIFVILSNNNNRRVSVFTNELINNNLKVKAYYSSKKPLKKAYLNIIKDFNIRKEEMCLIGDQLLTDVFGANRVAITSIYVDAIEDKDIIFTKINRFFEKRIIKSLHKDNFRVGEYFE